MSGTEESGLSVISTVLLLSISALQKSMTLVNTVHSPHKEYGSNTLRSRELAGLSTGQLIQTLVFAHTAPLGDV